MLHRPRCLLLFLFSCHCQQPTRIPEHLGDERYHLPVDHRVLFDVVVHLVEQVVEELHELCLCIHLRCDMVEGGSISLIADFGFR